MELFEIKNHTNHSDKNLLQTKHRVTFSSDIEEYEDEVSETESVEIQYKDDDDEAIEKEIAEIIERGERRTPITTEQSRIDNEQIDGLLKRMSIEEIYSNDEDSISGDNDEGVRNSNNSTIFFKILDNFLWCPIGHSLL